MRIDDVYLIGYPIDIKTEAIKISQPAKNKRMFTVSHGGGKINVNVDDALSGDVKVALYNL